MPQNLWVLSVCALCLVRILGELKWQNIGVTIVGVFGGTFDPPHNGHIEVARAVLASGAVDNIIVPVAADPWQKTGLGEITSFDIRFEMAVAAFDGIEGVVVSDIEQSLDGPSYTVDLLDALAGSGDVHKPIIGADAASTLATWHRVDDLIAGWEFIVINRPGHQITVPAELKYESIEMEPVDISSTDIRIAVANHQPIKERVSSAIDGLIQTHELYT